VSVLARLWVMGWAVALAGCDNGQSPVQLQAWLQEVRTHGGDAVVTVAQAGDRPPFVYTAQALRSPFQAAGEAGAGSWQTSLLRDDELDGNRPRQFLEGIDLEQFEMVGTLSSALQINALLRAKGVVHRLKIGDYLGRNNGQIASINNARVEVFEVISDGRGGWLERSLTIPLKQQS